MTVILPADPAAIAQAATILRAGGLVAFPTETVYGLGADATSEAAVARIYAAKRRPRFNPLIVHVAELDQAMAFGALEGDARRLAEAFWPGPLTLVLPAAGSRISTLALAGLSSIAVRVPAHPVALALLAAADRPLAAPSANRSGRISPTAAAHVADDLGGRVDLVLDGGACAVGVESTIVACLGTPTLLRPGGVPREAIEAVLGRRLAAAAPAAGAAPLAPGLLASHYAPAARLRLQARAVEPDEAVLDFGGQLQGWATLRPYCDLSPAGDLHAAAARLFAHLHALDRSGAPVIAVASIPSHGLGEAITDRLARAAAPREPAA